MNLLARFLLFVVLVLTLLMGAALFLHVFANTPVEPVSEPPNFPELTFEEVRPSFFSGIISKLSLLPSMGKNERELIAVVIENHEGARPHQRGLGEALLVQEYLVEGLISRFVALYDARNLPAIIGPVRSLRSYFIDGMMPLTHVILHAGGSPDALERAQKDPDIFNVNGLYFPDDFLRVEGIPAPHDLFTTAELIEGLLPEKMESARWPPYETGGVRGGTGAQVIDINFFSTLHNVRFMYEGYTGKYTRDNGGIVSDAHPSNVLILEVPILGVGEHGRLQMPIKGKGRALLFRSGKMVEGSWIKHAEKSMFSFEDAAGAPLIFARGQTWMIMQPSLDRVSWK